MKIRTSLVVRADIMRVMDLARSHVVCPKALTMPMGLCFSLCLPRPIQCSVANDRYYCFVDGGEWQFDIAKDGNVFSVDLSRVVVRSGESFLSSCIKSLTDTFEAKEVGDGLVKVTRISDLRLRWWHACMWPAFYSGTKLIHDYVFDSWKLALAAEDRVLPMLVRADIQGAISHVKEMTGLGTVAANKLATVCFDRYLARSMYQN